MNGDLLRCIDTHEIVITIDEKVYKLNDDFSKEEISEVPSPSKDKSTIVLHKTQFDLAKMLLLKKENPFRLRAPNEMVFGIPGGGMSCHNNFYTGIILGTVSENTEIIICDFKAPTEVCIEKEE